jgi:hypothetical protein
VGGAGVVSNDVAAVVDGRGSRGGSTGGCGAVDGRGGVLVGLCCFGLAADGGYSSLSAGGPATVVSDVARVVGRPGGSEGDAGVVDSRGVVPEGVCSFVWAVDGGFSSVCANGGVTVVSDVARVVRFLGGSSGDWDASRGVVDELGRAETCGGGAVRCSEAVVAGEVVVVAVDVVDDGCDIDVDACDAVGNAVVGVVAGGCGTSGGAGASLLGVMVFFGHSASKAVHKWSQVSFFVAGSSLHHRSAYERDFRCILNM